MDQLTISCVPEVHPSVNQTEQLAAMLSEVASVAFRLNMLGAQIQLEFSGSGPSLHIKQPLVSLPLPYSSRGAGYGIAMPFLHYGDSVHSYEYFSQTLWSDDSFEVSVDKVEKWLNQLAVVERNLAAFQCREPSPLEVVVLSS